MITKRHFYDAMFSHLFLKFFIRSTNFRTILLCFGLSLGASFFQNLCHADEGEELYQLPDYVVTASRTPQSIDQLSPSVSLISTQLLERSQWHSLSDVLLQMPGVFIVSNGGMGSVSSLFTRGSESNHTSILLNGRRLPSGFSGNYDFAQLSTQNLSSVEFIRGDSSSLHGDGAIGGILNLRTTRLYAGEKQQLSGELGSDATTRMTYDYSFAEGSTALSMSIDQISSDGYRPKESYERTSGNLYFEYAFNPVLDFDFQWLSYSSDLGVPGDARYWAGDPSDERNQTQSELWSPRLRLQLSDERELRFLYTYSTNQLDVLENAWGINGRYFERVNALDCSYKYSAKSGIFSQLLGLSLDRRNYHRSGYSDYRYRFQANALFSNTVWQFNPLTRVQLATRYSSYNHSYQSGWTGNLEIFRRLASVDGMRTFVKLSRGSSPPELSILKSDWEDILSEDYDLERIQSFECGIKHRLAPETEWGLVYFQNRINNLADSESSPSGLIYSIVDTDQKGMEAFLNSHLSDTIRYQLSYSYLDAKVKNSSQDGIYFGSDIGAQLIRRPMHKWLFAAYWDLDARSTLGAQWMAVANREDPAGVRFEDFSLLRIFADHSLTDRCKLYFRVENVFDEAYQWTAGYDGAPRSIALGANWSF